MSDEIEKQKEHASETLSGGKSERKHLAVLSLAALGVVFGDLGTSPLYAIRECFTGTHGVSASNANMFGIVSLIFWALTIIVTTKYLTFILRADSQGEGGVLVLTSLVAKMATKNKSNRWLLVAMGLFGAALLYGDGMITPAISVLSAVEGLKTVAPGFQPYVLPGTVVILTLLFLMQYRGTASIGAFFGPIIAVWLVTIGAFGLNAIIKRPDILKAVFPWYGIEFLLHNKLHGFLAMGSVFLCVTGAEALYADLGHFGKKPIRLVWMFFAMPLLLLNYFGQGAFLLLHPTETFHPFYGLVPRWFVIPMVILATMATVIASQAVISGAYSLTRQAMQYGYLPRMRILHTSNLHIGQIYVPAINWFLMISCIGLVLGFKTSSNLAAAYGVAVTATMLVSSMLFYRVARERWHWNRFIAFGLVGLFLIVDFTFFSANMTKIFNGAWFPLIIGGLLFLLMTTWKKGREVLSAELKARSVTFDKFMKDIQMNPPQRVEGQAVFMTGNPDIVPPAMLKNLSQNRILHSKVAVLNFASQDVPRVPDDEKVSVEELGSGFYRVHVSHGYMESPNIRETLELARSKGLDFQIEKISFFLGRERLLPGGGAMKPRLAALFAFMSRNAQDATAYFEIPTEQVMEVGVQLKI
jgi:KUP system potassium uptake protein